MISNSIKQFRAQRASKGKYSSSNNTSDTKSRLGLASRKIANSAYKAEQEQMDYDERQADNSPARKVNAWADEIDALRTERAAAEGAVFDVGPREDYVVSEEPMRPQSYGKPGGLVKEFEGYRSEAYNDPRTDKNGKQVGPNIYRAGYGSDTYTTADNKVHKVSQSNPGTEADHERDFDRRNVEEYNPEIKAALGSSVYENLSGLQLEVAQSLLHNYGTKAFGGSLSKVKAAMRSGDPAAVKKSIEALKGHNGGINSDRRSKEANMWLRYSGGSN